MPYSKSKARKDFESEVKTLVSVVKEAKATTISARIRAHILDCVVLPGSAKLEVYLEDLIGNWINSINGGTLTSNSIPKHLRAYLLHKGDVGVFKTFVAQNDESKLIEGLAGRLGRADYKLAIDTESLPPIQARMIWEGKKYPSPDNIRQLFFRLGINKIYPLLNAKGKCNIETLVKSYNDVRTAVAHQGLPVGMSPDDIIQKLQELSKVVACLDKVFYSHVVANTGSSTWTT